MHQGQYMRHGRKRRKTDINFVIRLTFNIPKVALRKFISFSDISFMCYI